MNKLRISLEFRKAGAAALALFLTAGTFPCAQAASSIGKGGKSVPTPGITPAAGQLPPVGGQAPAVPAAPAPLDKVSADAPLAPAAAFDAARAAIVPARAPLMPAPAAGESGAAAPVTADDAARQEASPEPRVDGNSAIAGLRLPLPDLSALDAQGASAAAGADFQKRLGGSAASEEAVALPAAADARKGRLRASREDEDDDWEPLPASIALKTGNSIGIAAPFAGFAYAVYSLWGVGIDLPLFALMTGMYVATGFGVTIGFHRFRTHGSFKAHPALAFVLDVLGSMALQGPMIQWVGMHRIHHKYSDRRRDPHSPYVSGSEVFAAKSDDNEEEARSRPAPTTFLANFWSRARGFMHAHIAWVMNAVPEHEAYVKDLRADRVAVVTDKLFLLWVGLGLAIPALIAGLIYGTWIGAGLGAIWGGLVRIFILHHVTYSINSVCHIWGQRPFKSRDESRNNVLFGLLGLGEGWHNGHHAFPTSARHGLLPWQFDLSYYTIRLFERLGLAWDVKIPTEGQMDAKRRDAVKI